MIITCPECETRYTVKAAAFKAPGRKVRCASCNNEWFQAPPEDAPKPVELEEPVEAAPAPEPEPAPETAAAAPAAEEATDETPQEAPAVAKPVIKRPAAVEETAIPEEEFSASDGDLNDDVAASKPAKFKPTAAPKRSRGELVGWAALVLFVVAFFGSAWAFRGDIARYWPSTASLYELIGTPVAEQGMEFRQVVYESAVENGLTVLSIRGEIVNVAEERGSVPRVRVALRDAEGQELYHYFFAIPEAELDAGATAEFVTRLSSPPAAARDLVLRFVEPGEYTGNETPVPSDET
ncbi:zinc-ribbon domain-containing protein [Pyruvatibacter sp. HU-CL02332]|uniref:DUF3426 domain-containing protein n=1 Tax=Pyruvatibacter sp. HU-CL02332 TaxID=3127650 RepID=UPI003103E602